MSQFINNPEHTFGFDTLQLHVGQESADPASDSRAVPIYQTTSYVFHNFDHAEARYGTDHGYGHHRRETEIWLLQQPADHRRACCAQYADRGFKYGRSPPLHVVGCLAVEKAQQASVQRGERQAGQNLADQNGRVAVQE